MTDTIIIGLVIIINAIIGYSQESNASNALERIKQMLSHEATVYRDGERVDVDSADLVVGDVVFLEAGDNVPADLRLFDIDNLSMQEAALTGESNSVEKKRSSRCRRTRRWRSALTWPLPQPPWPRLRDGSGRRDREGHRAGENFPGRCGRAQG
ncbi:P-type ATPase [Lacticaseibacillus camelliae]|uniref:P-type ATPase n=1 Tax=Lacticaseibacillus camelliae TaxID=381742 RepID=UPI0006D0FA7F